MGRKKENMRVVISVGKDEIGASELRRDLSARIEALRDTFNDLISASIACCWYSQESSLGSMCHGRFYKVLPWILQTKITKSKKKVITIL